MDPTNNSQVHINGPQVIVGLPLETHLYNGPRMGIKGPLRYDPYILVVNGHEKPSFRKVLLIMGLSFILRDSLHNHTRIKEKFLREVSKSLHGLSPVVGFGSHNYIHPYTSSHSRVKQRG